MRSGALQCYRDKKLHGHDSGGMVACGAAPTSTAQTGA